METITAGVPAFIMQVQNITKQSSEAHNKELEMIIVSHLSKSEIGNKGENMRLS